MMKVSRKWLMAAAIALLLVVAHFPGSTSARRGRRDEYDPDEFEGIGEVVGGQSGGDVASDDGDNVDAPPVAAAAAVDDDFDDEFDGEDVDGDDVDADGVDGEGSSGGVDAGVAPDNEEKGPESVAKPPTTFTSLFSGDRSYHMEAVAIVGLVLFVLVFIWGRRVNEGIASSFEMTFAEFLEQQFTTVLGNDPGRLVSKTSQNSFKLFATGRRGCKGLMCELDLCHRQNLLDTLMGVVSSREEDTLTLTFPKTRIEPFVLTVVHKLARKAVQRALPSLASYARVRSNDQIPESCELMTDCPEMVNKLLTEKVTSTLRNSEKWFRVLHISDESAVAETSSHLAACELRFQFALPPAGKMSELLPLMQMAVYLVDAVSSATMSSDARRIASKQRALREKERLNATRADREAAARARAEERAAKEEEEYQRMTPAQRARVDKKREAKRLKKMRPRMRMKAM